MIKSLDLREIIAAFEQLQREIVKLRKRIEELESE